MKFIISSSVLLGRLQTISRVIGSKNTLPILEYFLFNLSGNDLEITASDLESTVKTTLHIENVEDGGRIALPAKLLLDSLKEFGSQPLTFEIDVERGTVLLNSAAGQFHFTGQSGDDFPIVPDLSGEVDSFSIDVDVMLDGINKTLFATSDDEIRPVMGGILIEFDNEKVSFVSSDAHKLVRYRRYDVKSEVQSSFILPKKPAALLKNILPSEEGMLKVTYSEKNAYFTINDFQVISRLIEGTYPNYNSVIPHSNPHIITINRAMFHSALKRVSIFANQASNQVKLAFANDRLDISGQDIDFSVSGRETIDCIYDDEEIVIGFKSKFLLDILSTLDTEEIRIELADPTRAGLIVPVGSENEGEDLLMLLMPMMLN